MSLRTFHIVFITTSVLLALFFGVWALITGISGSSGLMVVAGLVSFVAGAALVLYGVSFARKIKEVA